MALTVAQTAAKYKCSEATVTRMIREKRIAAEKFSDVWAVDELSAAHYFAHRRPRGRPPKSAYMHFTLRIAIEREADGEEGLGPLAVEEVGNEAVAAEQDGHGQQPDEQREHGL